MKTKAQKRIERRGSSCYGTTKFFFLEGMSDSDTAKSTQTQETAPASSTETPVSATEDPTVVIPREGAQYNAEQCKEKLTASMEEMFAAMGDYARAELSSVTKDFALLQELNEAASHKYDGMAETATKLSVFLEDLQAHCLCFFSFFLTLQPSLF